MGAMLIDPDCTFMCPKCHDKKRVTYVSVMNFRAFEVKLENEHRCSTCGLQYELSHAKFAMGGSIDAFSRQTEHSQNILNAIYEGD